MPDELLVTASDPGRLDEAVAEVSRRLLGSVTGVTTLNPFAATLSLRPGILSEAFLRQIVPTLQGRGFSTDLNYLEPVLPINRFRPDDNPVEAADPGTGQGGTGRVLVVDSPADDPLLHPAWRRSVRPVDYDVDGNGFVDEDHGHGVYVASLIEQLAPGAEVVLAGVNGAHLPATSRWSPMVFSDADVIAAIGQAFGLSATGVERPFDVVNLSLGGAGCAGHRQPPRPRPFPARPRRRVGATRAGSARSTSRPRGTTAPTSSTSRRHGGTSPRCRRPLSSSTW